MTRVEAGFKRVFDLVFSLIGLIIFGLIIILCWAVATIETGENGFFVQVRIGKDGKPFRLFKIKSMRSKSDYKTFVTVKGDPRITVSGRFFRKTKLDELPQLINVLAGDMSFVGPRPDIQGYADELTGTDRIILNLRPGITGPASLQFRNEEELLAQQPDPEAYNRQVIWPEKVKINKAYFEDYSFLNDIKYIFQTIFSR